MHGHPGTPSGGDGGTVRLPWDGWKPGVLHIVCAETMGNFEKKIRQVYG